MIEIKGLTKSYGENILFENASFSINKKDKIGLVGRNGYGKTTLFRMIMNEESPDEGEIIIPKDYKIGYLKQHIDFTKDDIVTECMSALPVTRQHSDWLVKKLLIGLGFTESDFFKNPYVFSGGFQIRLNLIKVLVAEPDLLLLDEPTNYLDIVSIRWLSNFLKNWKSELLLITHDRGFMDNVITYTAGIYRKKIKKIEGLTGKYYDYISNEDIIYEKTRQNIQKKKEDNEKFIQRFRAKARLAGLVQSRIKMLEKQEDLSKLEEIKKLEFDFNYKPFPAKYLMSVDNISFSYEKASRNFLIKDFDLSVKTGDKICIIGPNGKGKSTLMKLMNNFLNPISGTIDYHNETDIGYFAQENISFLNVNNTVADEIYHSNYVCTNQDARNICGTFMFSADDAMKKISVLSGGEKSRVSFAKIVATPVNLLLLDEPTNHLDIETCGALAEAINNFPGAVILVTHNEMLLNAVSNRLVIFDRNKIIVYEGSYSEFLDSIGWEAFEENLVNADKKKYQGTKSSDNKKELRKKRAEIIREKSAVLNPIKEKINNLENKIQKMEVLVAANNEKIISASQKNQSDIIVKVSIDNAKLKEELDLCYENLEPLLEKYDELIQKYETLLEE